MGKIFLAAENGKKLKNHKNFLALCNKAAILHIHAFYYITDFYFTHRVKKMKNTEIHPINQEMRTHRFKRIATKRTNDIIRKIHILGNCSNRSSYDYTEQEVNKIFAAIGKELKSANARFSFGRRNEFKL